MTERSTRRAGELFVHFIRGDFDKVALLITDKATEKDLGKMMSHCMDTIIPEARIRRTTGLIADLEDNEVFVFGSNLSGIHGKGAAKQALKWGARLGVGEGEVGRTYAVPTKAANVKKTLSVKLIEEHVKRFLDHASSNPDKTYLVTEIGCGLAGLKPDQVGPLFSRAVLLDNIHLPKRFWKAIEKSLEKKYSKIIEGVQCT